MIYTLICIGYETTTTTTTKIINVNAMAKYDLDNMLHTTAYFFCLYYCTLHLA